MKSEKFTLTITEKGVSAVIRTATKKKAGKTHHYFIVEYITKEGRKQVWRSSEEKAREAAKSACNDILNGKDLSLQLKDSDRMAYVIYLEDSMVLLRWGISRKEALSVGQPFDKDNPIKWEEKILDGQPCELIVNLADGAVFDEARARFHRRHTAAP